MAPGVRTLVWTPRRERDENVRTPQRVITSFWYRPPK